MTLGLVQTVLEILELLLKTVRKIAAELLVVLLDTRNLGLEYVDAHFEQRLERIRRQVQPVGIQGVLRQDVADR